MINIKTHGFSKGIILMLYEGSYGLTKTNTREG